MTNSKTNLNALRLRVADLEAAARFYSGPRCLTYRIPTDLADALEDATLALQRAEEARADAKALAAARAEYMDIRHEVREMADEAGDGYKVRAEIRELEAEGKAEGWEPARFVRQIDALRESLVEDLQWRSHPYHAGMY